MTCSKSHHFTCCCTHLFFPKQCNLLGVLNAFLRCPPWCSRGLVSPCLHTSVPVLAGVSAFPRTCLPLSPSLSLIVSPHACLCWMVCPLSEALSPIVSPCLPSLSPSCLPACFPFLDGVHLPEALSPSLTPSLSPFLFPFVGWCVRLPKVLSPLVSPQAYLC